MIQVSKIQNALVGIVGFNQPYNPSYAIVDAENLLSDSGYFVTDNPYAKIEYIKDNQDFLKITDTDFNLLLKDLKKRSISNVCNQVFSDYDFIDRSLLFKNASNKTVLEVLPIGFVGYRIKVTSEKNIAFKISRVLLDFDGAGTFTLLVFNSSKKEPIYTQEVTITTDHQEVVLDWVLDNSSSTYKGDYYIGYINNNLDVKPFKREFNNASVMTKFNDVCIEKVSVINHLTGTLFDLQKVEGLSQHDGLNFDISVYEDFTDFVINNKNLFAKAVCLDMVIQCMQMYLSSLRSNRNQMIAEQLYEKVIAELEGTNPDSVIRVKGMKPQLIGEISSIRKEIQKMKKGFFKSGQILVSTLE